MEFSFSFLAVINEAQRQLYLNWFVSYGRWSEGVKKVNVSVPVCAIRSCTCLNIVTHMRGVVHVCRRLPMLQLDRARTRGNRFVGCLFMQQKGKLQGGS
jgi:hypothetical protein